MEPIRRLVSILAPILIAVPPAATPAAESKAAPTGLLDKTLVAWICPANLTQRGGSVLTIDDSQSHFDGIVFGELMPKRWMAGSDGFSCSLQHSGRDYF
jgi:hypothetical protein